MLDLTFFKTLFQYFLKSGFVTTPLNVIYRTGPLNYLSIQTKSRLIHLEQCEAVV